MLYQLIYRSRVSRHVRFADVQHIAQRASERNAAIELSGLLLYTPTHFVQLLEGEEANVKKTFERISTDGRHSGVHVIVEGPIQKRAFGVWGMRAVLPRLETSSQAIEMLDESAARQLLLHASVTPA